MLKRYLERPTLTVWIVSLLLVSLILTACGGAAQPTTEASAESVETQAPADTSVDTSAEEVAAEESPTEEKQTATEQDPAADVETPTVSAEVDDETAADAALADADCQSADPNEDPIAGVTGFLSEYIDANSTNDAIPAISDSDWVKGPDDAPVTIIEYGDFQ